VNRIYGEKGQITLGRTPRIYTTEATADFKAGEWQDIPIPASGQTSSRALIVDGFSQAIQNGTPPPVRAEDGRAALEIAMAAYQSGQEQRPITLR